MEYRTEQVTSRNQFKDFLRLTDIIYKNDPGYVKPVSSELKRVLNTMKNPYFSKAFLNIFNCYRDNKICARLVVIINPDHQKKYGTRSAHFGFFEAVNDSAAVESLLNEAEQYCRGMEVQSIEGPFNPNHYSEIGLQTNNFGITPNFFKPYNPAYYRNLLENAGFKISKKLHTRRNDNIKKYLYERYNGQNFNAPGYSVRSLRINELSLELERMREVFNDAFSDNWHFIPVNREEYLFSSKYLKLVTEPWMIKFVEYDGKPVAAIHCALDINPALKKLEGSVGPVKYFKFISDRKKIDTLVVFAIGIKKSFQHTKAFNVLLGAGISIARKYNSIVSTWMSEDNKPAVKAAEKLGMVPFDELAIYEKKFNGIR